MEALAARDRLAASIGQRVDQLSKQMQTLNADADDLQKKQAALDRLQESLAQVDDLAKRTAWQYDNLKQSRQDLDALRKDIQDFYKSHAAAVQLRDRLASRPRRARGVPRSDDGVQRRAAGARGADGRDHQQARDRRRGHAEGREPRRRSPTISIGR